MKLPVDNVAGGLVLDMPSGVLPDGRWTDSRGVRYREGGAEKVKGVSAVFGSASATPIWLMPGSDGITNYWVYGSASRLYATDGSSHADVSSISYTADPVLGYTGGAYHGFVLANDSVNPPHFWTPSLSNKFQPFTAWPASTTAQVVRPFGDFIVALRVTESGTYNSRLIRWSDRGAAGSMPASWDYTDPTNQAGRTELGQTHDKLIDCLPLRDANAVYKGFHTWLMTYVGGDDVFQFREVLKESGLLSEDCVRAFRARHFVLTDNDVVVFDGNDAQSIADKRLRRWLFNRLSPSRFRYTFVAADQREREMWICFPEDGYSYPNLAAVWSWMDDSWDVRELQDNMIAAASASIDASGATFDADTGTFDTGESGGFDDSNQSPSSQRLVFAPASKMQLYLGNDTYQWAGSNFAIYATRSNMALTKNVGRIKRVTRIFPKLVGADGETVQFRIGSSNHYESSVTFQGPINFTIGTDYKLECRVTGRFIHLYMSYTGGGAPKLIGFDVDFFEDGHR